MKLLGIDPGRVTGYFMISMIDRDISPTLQFGECRDLTMIELVPLIQEAEEVVCESFEVRPKKAKEGAFDWDPMETPQVIGSLKSLCSLYGKPIHMQSPSIKPVGYGFANAKYQKGKKGMHIQDALAHVVYYAVRRLNAKPL